jgi:glycyl-tRNA synthetase beta subunit
MRARRNIGRRAVWRSISAACRPAQRMYATRSRARQSARRNRRSRAFLRKAGIASIAEAHVHSDPKKGDFYVAHIVKPGRAADEIIAQAMPKIIREFPWPKVDALGKGIGQAGQGGSLRWVRPLQSIICLLSTEPEEPVVVDFEVDGICVWQRHLWPSLPCAGSDYGQAV